jgi:biopolymer transport protein ExbD
MDDHDGQADSRKDENRAPTVITIDENSAPLIRSLNEAEKYYVHDYPVPYQSLKSLLTNDWLESDVITFSIFVIVFT